MEKAGAMLMILIIQQSIYISDDLSRIFNEPKIKLLHDAAAATANESMIYLPN